MYRVDEDLSTTNVAKWDVYPRFSIIIPVHNRVQDLQRLMKSLGCQTFPRDRFELIICDDGSTENLIPPLKDGASQYALRIIYLRQEQSGPGTARNLGLAHARGDIAVFADSDCIPWKDWLENLDRAFEVTAPDMVGGQITYKNAQHISGRCICFLLSTSLGGGGVLDPRSSYHMHYYPPGGNVAVRRSLALESGGFPSLSYCEDIEFSHRIHSLGARIEFVPTATVVHNEKKGLMNLFEKSVRRGIARAFFQMRCCDHQLIHWIPSILVVTLLCSGIVACVWPSTMAFSLVPWAVYLLVLLILSLQGVVVLGELRALLAIPSYALMMHVGYGLGYLSAVARLAKDHSDRRPVDWNQLRTHFHPIEFMKADACFVQEQHQFQ